MPLYSLKLSTYDPEIISAFERLRKNRKQATFTHEAIKQFLSTERGKQVLAIMEGGTFSQQLPTHSAATIVIPVVKSPVERISATGDFIVDSHADGSDVLNSILK